MLFTISCFLFNFQHDYSNSMVDIIIAGITRRTQTDPP